MYVAYVSDIASVTTVLWLVRSKVDVAVEAGKASVAGVAVNLM
jgi:hypothetical protein